jgi:hypothetical protein
MCCGSIRLARSKYVKNSLQHPHVRNNEQVKIPIRNGLSRTFFNRIRLNRHESTEMKDTTVSGPEDGWSRERFVGLKNFCFGGDSSNFWLFDE